jgi:hypothetical protein
MMQYLLTMIDPIRVDDRAGGTDRETCVAASLLDHPGSAVTASVIPAAQDFQEWLRGIVLMR